ncbi:MAG: DUF2934 domain-containing protein [Pseudomonadota bacterium]|nr:DUF2934 domain-containing protein [Pseudomonadota bacterium]
MDALVDEAIDETFPASDPPSYMAGAGVIGPPPHDDVVREPPFTELLSPPGEDADDAERRTRERAYFLWEQEGRPEDRADAHWHAARGEEGKT